MYEKELEAQKAKVEKMKADNPEEHGIKQQVSSFGCRDRGQLRFTRQCCAKLKSAQLCSGRGMAKAKLPVSAARDRRVALVFSLFTQEQVLAESEVMIPDCRGRLESAFQELKNVVVRQLAGTRAMMPWLQREFDV